MVSTSSLGPARKVAIATGATACTSINKTRSYRDKDIEAYIDNLTTKVVVIYLHDRFRRIRIRILGHKTQLGTGGRSD